MNEGKQFTRQQVLLIAAWLGIAVLRFQPFFQKEGLAYITGTETVRVAAAGFFAAAMLYTAAITSQENSNRRILLMVLSVIALLASDIYAMHVKEYALKEATFAMIMTYVLHLAVIGTVVKERFQKKP